MSEGISNSPVEGPDDLRWFAEEEVGGASNRERSSSLSFSWSEMGLVSIGPADVGRWTLCAARDELKGLL